MGSGGKGSMPQAQQPELAKAIRVQTSTYGAVRPIVYGVVRIAPTLIWYGGLEVVVVEHRTEVGK